MGVIRRLKNPKKVAHTDKHKGGHRNLETELAQWADSVKSTCDGTAFFHGHCNL